MSLEELFTGPLHPAKIQASLNKPRLCDDTTLLRHLSSRLAVFPHYTKKAKQSASDAALTHFHEHRSMDFAIKVGVQAAQEHPTC